MMILKLTTAAALLGIAGLPTSGRAGSEDMSLSDNASAQRDFLPMRSGTPATFWSGAAAAGSSFEATGHDEIGGGGSEPSDASPSAEERRAARGGSDYLPRRSGTPAAFWSGAVPMDSSSAATGHDEVGGGTGEPSDASSSADEQRAQSGGQGFLPTRSGLPATLWSGSPSW